MSAVSPLPLALRYRFLIGSAMAAGMVSIAPAAAAPLTGSMVAVDATAADEAGSAEDDAIVVTASRRRDEDVQDVPVAISVVDAAALERRGDFTLGQIQQQVPSLQVFSFNPRNTNVNIRGLGSNVALTTDGMENGVGFYIDNVYYGRVGLSQFDLVDLESVEVLRGPQGTLFGKNTTAGVINITTRKPVFQPELSAEASAGNAGYRQIRASASGALVADRLAIRLSGALTDNDGFLYNVTRRARAQDYNNVSVRGQLLFTPTDTLAVRLIGDFSRQRQNFVLSSFVANYTTFAEGTPIPNSFTQRLARFPAAVVPSFTPFDRLGYADSRYQANMDGYGLSGQVDWDLGGAKLTAITAYRWWDWKPANDGDATNLPVVTRSEQANRQRQFTQEVRLASASGGRIDYVVGGYYFWQIIRGYGVTAYGPAAALWNFAAPSAAAAAAINGFEANSTSTPETHSIGAFGQVDWKIADRLTLTSGLRFTHETKQGAFRQFWVAGADLAGLTPPEQAQATAIRSQFNPVVSYATRFADDSLSGLLSLSWKVTPNVLAYASYSRGSKSGGLNLTALPVGITPDVRPERVDAWEVGLKTAFLDRRGTFNAAAFWTEIGNYQTAITDQAAGSPVFRQYIANIPKVRSRGVEGELAFAPTEHLRFTASATYTDAVYVSYRNAPQAVERQNQSAVQDLSGERLPGIARFAWTVGGDADLPLGDDRAIYAHADYSYRSSFNTSATNSERANIPGFGLVTARLGLRGGDGRWDLSAWTKNLFNKQYFLNLSPANTGVVTGQLGEPRTYGLTLRTKL